MDISSILIDLRGAGRLAVRVGKSYLGNERGVRWSPSLRNHVAESSFCLCQFFSPNSRAASAKRLAGGLQAVRVTMYEGRHS